ncbi:MFS transporter [Streptomyces sp. NBC_00690]|uniref:MFS transporter n=1 Tax=Streptomyces sp. NBC_00690 TaxID=2975808 RepID=UPI002E2D3855|nr:MFS transporter [Streptomyces sp. NBC_00690]
MKNRYALRVHLTGAAVARTGDEMSGPALLLTALALTGSTATASVLLAGMTFAAAVGGPLLGLLLDRSTRPGALLAAALAGHCLALLAVLWTLHAHGELPLVMTLLIALGAGLLGPVLSAGWTSQLPRLAGPAALPRATALDAMTFHVAALVGPALAGTAAGLLGAGTGVVVAAVLIALSLPAALSVPPDPSRRAARNPRSGDLPVLLLADRRLRTELRSGYRATVRNRPLARATTVTVISCAGEGAFVVCVPLLGGQLLGDPDRGVILLSGIAVAAVAANALLARRPPRRGPDRILNWSPLALALAYALMATGQPVLLVVAVVLAGAGEGPQLTALFTIRHREAPERLRAQIFTTGASLKLTGFAVGAALAGLVISLGSLTAALLAAAAVQLIAALCAAPTTARHPGRLRFRSPES